MASALTGCYKSSISVEIDSDILNTLLPGVSLTLLLSAGCAVGPNYKRPSVDVPGMYRGRTPQDAAQPAPESLGDLERWEVFHDKQLQDLIHTGLNRTTMFASRQREILEAQAH